MQGGKGRDKACHEEIVPSEGNYIAVPERTSGIYCGTLPPYCWSDVDRGEQLHVHTKS